MSCTTGPLVGVVTGGAMVPGLLRPPDLTPQLTVALAALALVGLVGLGLGVLWWRRARRLDPAAELLAVLRDRTAVDVLMHPNPDPDAMAAALAVSHLAEHVGTPASVQYPGEIRHPENRVLLTVLDLDYQRIERAEDLTGDAVVLVDHNRPRGFEGADEVVPDVVVDHHPGGGEGTALTDVRPSLGATASILAEYFEELDAEPVVGTSPNSIRDDQLSLPGDVATALAYGILSDTKRLTRGCAPADFAAMAYLHPAVDGDLLDRIANPQVDAEVLDVEARAISERDERPPYAVSDAGVVGNLDAIPEAADELLRLEGVASVVVLGQREDTLYISGRSRDDRVHIGRALERAVDGMPDATAGGHSRMGGGQVPLEHVEASESDSEFIQPAVELTRGDFHERLFDAMAGEEGASG